MKRKVMRALFALLFVAGLIAGFLIPWDIRDLNKQLNEKKFQPVFIDVPKKMGQLDQSAGSIKYSVVAGSDSAEVQLVQLDGKIPLHIHSGEDHIIYVYKGMVRFHLGNNIQDIGSGEMVVVPKGVKHSVEKVGDAPAEAIVIEVPHSIKNDTVYLEK